MAKPEDRHMGVLRWQRPFDPWVTAAFREMAVGVREIQGEKHNPRIVNYFDHVTFETTTDESPWCSAAMCWLMHSCGLPSTMDARARSWESWGQKLPDFQFGAVTVLWRGRPNGWQGHVGLAMRHTDEHVWLLGGNQNDEWGIDPYSKEQLVGYFWPSQEDYSFEGYYPFLVH